MHAAQRCVHLESNAYMEYTGTSLQNFLDVEAIIFL